MNDEVNQGVLAAVTAGLKEANGGAPPAAAAPIETEDGHEDPGADDTGTDADADPNQAGGDGDSAGSVDNAGGKAGEAAAAADGKIADDAAAAAAAAKDGKPAAKTPEQEAADKAAANAAAAATDDGKPKPKDPLNDPIPNALKKETKERMVAVIDIAKQATSRAEAAERTSSELLGMIEQTRATPKQYGDALEYLALVNSGDPAQLERALQIMQAEVAAVARMLGKPVPGVNMLEGHQDLIDDLAAGRITVERANEIAAGRAQRAHMQSAHEAARQDARVTAEQAQAMRAGQRDLNELEKRLMTDPAYPAKRGILIKALKPVFAKIPPADWAATFERAYKELPAPVAAVPSGQARAVPSMKTAAADGGNTPLRAGQPSGSQAPAPTSLQEAIKQGINAANR